MPHNPVSVPDTPQTLNEFITGSLHSERGLILTEWHGCLTDLAVHIREVSLTPQDSYRLLMKSADRVQRRINRLLYTTDNPDTQEN